MAAALTEDVKVRNKRVLAMNDLEIIFNRD